MNILDILKNRKNELYLHELEFFVAELKTGDYSKEYVKECLTLISDIKKMKKPQNVNVIKELSDSFDSKSILINPSDLIDGYKCSNKEDLSCEEQVKVEIVRLRKKSDYNTLFMNFVNECDLLDEPMIENIFNFLTPFELSTLIELRKFSETFLDKFFADLDHSKIAKHQYFSEDFFIRHYNDLNYNTVLQKGINEWRKRENRSNRLNVFLRLKGVTI